MLIRPLWSLGQLNNFRACGANNWVAAQVEDEELPAHSIILTARSPVFRALLNSDMREVQEGVITIEDIRPQVFNAMLHFIYKDALPEVPSPLPVLMLYCHPLLQH